MNARKAAIRRTMDREPSFAGKHAPGRPQYGGAGLTRNAAERQFGRVLNKLAFGSKSSYAGRGKRYARGVKGSR